MRLPILTTALAFALPAIAAGQTIDEIVAKNLQSRGGVEKIRAVKATRITGAITLGGGGLVIPMTISSERPNKVRQESVLDGQQLVTAYDGVTAWQVNPMMGITSPKPFEGPQADMIRDQADVDGPFVDYKAKGTTLELLGTETLDGKPVHKIRVTRKSGRSQLLYLSADTALEHKAVVEVPPAEGSVAMTIESVFSDYKMVEGLMIAHQISQQITGPQSTELTIAIQKIEVLPDLDDAIFRMPGAKP